MPLQFPDGRPAYSSDSEHLVCRTHPMRQASSSRLTDIADELKTAATKNDAAALEQITKSLA